MCVCVGGGGVGEIGIGILRELCVYVHTEYGWKVFDSPRKKERKNQRISISGKPKDQARDQGQGQGSTPAGPRDKGKGIDPNPNPNQNQKYPKKRGFRRGAMRCGAVRCGALCIVHFFFSRRGIGIIIDVHSRDCMSYGVMHVWPSFFF